MNVLVINAGSSSLKFQVIATDLERIKHDQDELLCRGQVERIGGMLRETIARHCTAYWRNWPRLLQILTAIAMSPEIQDYCTRIP